MVFLPKRREKEGVAAFAEKNVVDKSFIAFILNDTHSNYYLVHTNNYVGMVKAFIARNFPVE